jgi:hypothetical protein
MIQVNIAGPEDMISPRFDGNAFLTGSKKNMAALTFN